jgi:hypothetical protein
MKISAERAICYVVKRGLVCAAQDSYLVGKMDKDHYVDVSVIAEFKLIKQLTTDVDLIIASVKGSEQVRLVIFIVKVFSTQDVDWF